jgi:glycosyltransferase involved in cell wall biosynthesis
MKKIALDCRTILNPGFGEGAGVGHYTYYLVQHLLKINTENEFILFFDKQAGREIVQSLVNNQPRVQIRFFPFHEYRHYLPGFYSHLLISAVIAREQPDLLHIPGGVIPLSYPRKVVLTVHDLAIYKHPEYFPKQTLSTKVLYPQSLKKAFHLIAPSQQTARDLEEIFKIKKEKISVIYEGVAPRQPLFDVDIIAKEDVIDLEDLEEKYKIKTPYFFFLGTIEPRKNIEFLVKAFSLLLEKNPSLNIQLVLAGARGWKNERIFRTIEEVNKKYASKDPVINYLGYVPHQDKWALFEKAIAFLYPSLYEGFGLPPLEAMAVGTPVITAATSSLLEVVGSGGILLDPQDLSGWVNHLEKILKDSEFRANLSKKAKERSSSFSWSKCAEETMELYQRLLREQ